MYGQTCSASHKVKLSQSHDFDFFQNPKKVKFMESIRHGQSYKIVPSVFLGSRDFPTAKTYFTKFGIKLAGSMQWTQRKSFSNFSRSNVEIVN
jgi:hypothetical protein